MAPRSDTRGRLLEAATAEFVARGFTGTTVDRIAHRAGVNKAMIYYHFASKVALYREILRDLFSAAGARARAVLSSRLPPERKLTEFVAALVEEAQQRPHFPPMMLRELLEGGRHLDRDTIALLVVLPQTFHAIVDEGVARRVFRPVHPLLSYFTLVGPVVMHNLTAPVRQEAGRLGLAQFPQTDSATLVEHLQSVALSLVGLEHPRAATRAKPRARHA